MKVQDMATESALRRLLTVDEVAERLGLGLTKVYELLGRGEIASVRIGTARRVPASALEAYVEGGPPRTRGGKREVWWRRPRAPPPAPRGRKPTRPPPARLSPPPSRAFCPFLPPKVRPPLFFFWGAPL